MLNFKGCKYINLLLFSLVAIMMLDVYSFVYEFLELEIFIAEITAHLKDSSFAMFLALISYATPCTGDVRITFIPAVKFTPLEKESALNGISP